MPIASERHEFAPNCVWQFEVPDHEALDQRLLALIEAERAATPESRECAGRQLWQSQRPVQDDPPVRELMRSVFAVARDIAGFYRWDLRGRAPVCTVCWANVHYRGSYHTRHIHPATVQLSGTYYVHAPPGCGDLVFHDLPQFLGLWGAIPPRLEATPHNMAQLRVSPRAGLCVLFPAHLMHEVEANVTDGDRVGLAFNINFE